MKIKKFLKPTKLKIVFSFMFLIFLQVGIFFMFLGYYSQFGYCLSLNCPTSQTETMKMMSNLLIPIIIISYLSACWVNILCKK